MSPPKTQQRQPKQKKPKPPTAAEILAKWKTDLLHLPVMGNQKGNK